MTEPALQPTADGLYTLHDPQAGQTYHSTHGARLEAEHVYLTGAGVAARLRASHPTHVLEVGFGAGLNFILTAQCALASGTSLCYRAMENRLLPSTQLARLGYGVALGAENLWDALLRWREGLPEGRGEHTFRYADSIACTLLLGEASEQSLEPNWAHAVYQDAFSPAANPGLWTEEWFATLRAASRNGAWLSTYCAKGAVRRAMAATGWRPERRDGPPGKRHILVAQAV